MTQPTAGKSQFDETSASRLATVKVDRLDIDTLKKRMSRRKRDLFEKAMSRDPEFMTEIVLAFKKFEKAAEHARKSSAANVSTDNARGILDVITPNVLSLSRPDLNGQSPLGYWLETEARVTAADLKVIQKPGKWVTLDGFHKLLYAAWLLDGRPDSIFRFAMHMLRSGSRSAVGELILAVQPLDMKAALEQLALAMGFYNDTKEGELVFAADDHGMIKITIKPWIRPDDDYLSRFFAASVITHNMPCVIWEPYLEDVVGVSYDDILEEFQRIHSVIPHPSIVGDIFSEGVWQWWLNQHPDLAERHQLPRQLRFDVDVVCEQFPLYEAIRTHMRLAEAIPMERDDHPSNTGILWSHEIEWVGDRGPVLFARINGIEHQIAHRVVVTGSKNSRPTWRELEPGESWQGLPYVVDKTIALCHSAEWGGRIDICTYYRRTDERQLWGMPYTLLAINWKNPPKPDEEPTLLQTIAMRFKRLRRSRLGVMRTIGGAAYQFAATLFRDERRSLKAIRKRMERRLGKVRGQMEKATVEYLELLATAGNDFQTFQKRFDEILKRYLDESNRKHIQRLTDLGMLFIAQVKQLPPEQLRLLTLDRDALPDEVKKDARFQVAYQVVEFLKFAFKVHDTGKIFLDEETLNAANPSKETIEFLKSHIDLGWSVLKQLYPDMLWLIVIALLHHENEDGSGYPWGLTGNQIPLLAKVLRILDVFDAMRGDRPYRRPYFCSLATVLRSYLNGMRRGWIHVPLTVLFCRFLRWLRTELAPQRREVLESYGLSEAMIEYLHGTEVLDMQDYGFEEVDEELREKIRQQFIADQAAEPGLFQQIEDEFGHQADTFTLDLDECLAHKVPDLDAISAARKRG